MSHFYFVGRLLSFTGPKRPRTSGRWRPFAPEGLSADSQAYAVRVLRAAFAWLVEVRYLAGNPWSAVHEPATVTRELSVQVHRALPAKLWAQVRKALDARCDIGGETEADDEARQWRAARAAILLMGDSGLRRAEAALGRREDLRIAETTEGRAGVTPRFIGFNIPSDAANSNPHAHANAATIDAIELDRTRPRAGDVDLDHRWQASQAAYGAREWGDHCCAPGALARPGP